MTIYDKGDRARVHATFTDINGTPINPTAITVTVKAPNSSDIEILAPIQVVQVTTGQYYVDLDLNEVGVWRFKWTATGALYAVQESHLTVRASYVG